MRGIDDLSEHELLRLRDGASVMPDSFAVTIRMVDRRLAEFAAERQRQQAEAERERQRQAEERRVALAEAERLWAEDPVNEATVRGWEAMRKIVPNLDGVNQFSELAPALQYRYAAFARAVLGKPADPRVVLSTKQEAGRTELPVGMVAI